MINIFLLVLEWCYSNAFFWRWSFWCQHLFPRGHEAYSGTKHWATRASASFKATEMVNSSLKGNDTSWTPVGAPLCRPIGTAVAGNSMAFQMDVKQLSSTLRIGSSCRRPCRGSVGITNSWQRWKTPRRSDSNSSACAKRFSMDGENTSTMSSKKASPRAGRVCGDRPKR